MNLARAIAHKQLVHIAGSSRTVAQDSFITNISVDRVRTVSRRT